MIQVISHRGFWTNVTEKNTEIAFERSFNKGFGTETDIRDYNGKIVIAHDIATARDISLERFFEIYNYFDNSLPLALNIKSNGLLKILKFLISKYKIESYFLFDLTVPEILICRELNLNFFSRQSEYESQIPLYNEACGIWLDEFHNHWIKNDIIQNHLAHQKKVCIVSPELHSRSYLNEWEHYKEIKKSILSNNLMICTDYPEKLNSFINE